MGERVSRACFKRMSIRLGHAYPPRRSFSRSSMGLDCGIERESVGERVSRATAVCAAQQSAACRPEAKLPAVSMAIYTSAYHVTILLKNAGLEEPQDAALKEWRESVGERVSRALEDRHVRPTQEQINKNLVGIHTRHTRHVVKADSSRSILLGTEFSN